MQNNKWVYNDGKAPSCSRVKLLSVLNSGPLSSLHSWSVMHGQLRQDAMSTVTEAGSKNMMGTHKRGIKSFGGVGVQVIWGLIKEKDMNTRDPRQALLGRDVPHSRRPTRGLAQGPPFRRGGGLGNSRGRGTAEEAYLSKGCHSAAVGGGLESQSSKGQ